MLRFFVASPFTASICSDVDSERPTSREVTLLWGEIRRLETRFEKAIDELKDQIEAHHTTNVKRLDLLNTQVNQGLGVLAATKYLFHLLWGIGGALAGYMFNRLTSK